MRNTILALLLSVTSLYAAEISLDYFTAKSDGKTITVSWKSSSERNLQRYEIERSGLDMTFKTIAQIDAKGAQSSYYYSDEDAFMKQNDDNPTLTQQTKYSYRLKYVGTDNTSTYSSPTNVSHSVSGVRRTWGMIKEMFR
ncbi:MAG: hypothetical protein IPM69_11765 [Ignavibacteria bacterium]|nr:hypothetical protein [Ignavibacteria bacterium]